MDLSDAFLRDIFDHPDDVVPRLIYADWLTEHDDPRGEAVRLRCRLEALPQEDPLLPDLRGREEELWAVHADDWIEQAGLPLTWDEAIGLFRRRLGEAAAWCGLRAGHGRTPKLRPERFRSRSPHDCLLHDPQRSVARLAAERARLLGSRPRPAISAESGRLLVFFPEESLWDGAAELEAPEYFDVDNVPAWDTWVWFNSDRDARTCERGLPSTSLLSWVPGAQVNRVARGIHVNPEMCIEWMSKVKNRLTERLQAEGFLG